MYVVVCSYNAFQVKVFWMLIQLYKKFIPIGCRQFLTPFKFNTFSFFMFPFAAQFKKLRNNVYKSHEALSAKRILAKGVPPRFIVLKNWEDAFAWDQQHCLPLHHKLRPEHLELTASSLMRNHLAEQVLNKDIL